MPHYEVPSSQWADFCQAFSNDHAGEIIRIEMVDGSAPGNDSPKQPHAAIPDHEGTLRGIACESDRDGEAATAVTIGTKAADGEDLAHVLIRPSRVALEQPKDREGLLVIETKENQTAVVHLTHEAVPGNAERPVG